MIYERPLVLRLLITEFPRLSYQAAGTFLTRSDQQGIRECRSCPAPRRRSNTGRWLAIAISYRARLHGLREPPQHKLRILP